MDWNHVTVSATSIAAAMVLGGLIGVERHVRHKSAGMRTHALVAMGSCLFTVISMDGFEGMVDYEFVRDPARIAAQIVSGIGFLGAGVIFVNRDVVRGLTTAASIWLAAALGMATGAGLYAIAGVTTVLYFAAVFGFGALGRIVPQSNARTVLVLTYLDGHGILRDVLTLLTRLGCEVTLIEANRDDREAPGKVRAELRVRSGPPLPAVLEQVSALTGVVDIARTSDED